MALLGGFSSAQALAEVSLGGGHVGLGATVSQSTTAGASGGAAAEITGYNMSMGYSSSYNGHPTNAVMGSVQYNAIGGARDGFATGVAGRGQFFVGGTLLGSSDNGCDLYLGVGGSIRAGLHSNRPGDSGVSGNIGPETGLLCQMMDVLIMISPTVGVGGGYSATKEIASGDGGNLVTAGGRARIGIKKVGMASVEVVTAPKISSSNASFTEGKFEMIYNLTDKTDLGGYFRITDIKDNSGEEASGGEASAFVSRAF